MDGDVFYYVGGVLILAALVISFIGIRGHEKFPPNRGVMVAVIAIFALLVIGTTSLAVVLAREEQDHRRHEQAEELAKASEGVGANEQPPGENESKPPSPGTGPDVDVGTPPGRGAQTTLDVASPEDGSLVFEPDGLQARPGTVTLHYTNPSPVPHSIAIEASGDSIAESEEFTDGDTEISAELGPGEFVFYCTVPGHRQAGMEGTLTIAG
jgi:plastocyanin